MRFDKAGPHCYSGCRFASFAESGMGWAETMVQALKESDTSLIAYVPDISIHQVTSLIEEDPFFHLVSATREEEAHRDSSGRPFRGAERRGIHAVQRVRQLHQRGGPACAYQPERPSPSSSTCVVR